MNKTESGNVLFLILIAVVLFAALSYVVTQSTRSGGGSTEKENVRLYAARIQNHLASLQLAAQRLIASGVPVEKLSLYHPDRVTWDGSPEPNPNPACTDNSCRLYSPGAGGVPYEKFDAYLDPSNTNKHNGQILQFWECIKNQGSERIDFLLQIQKVSDTLCRAINRISNTQESIPDETSTNGGFATLNKFSTCTNYKGDVQTAVLNANGFFCQAGYLKYVLIAQ